MTTAAAAAATTTMTPTPTPLPIRVLRRYPTNDPSTEDHVGHGAGYYQVLHRLYSASPCCRNDDDGGGGDGGEGEIETALEQYVMVESRTDATGNDTAASTRTTKALWRRVVIRSGPSAFGGGHCSKPVIHASYQLPDDCTHATYATSTTTTTAKTSLSILCWTAFPDRPHHLMLCVLASPTLLCIWDVYPEQGQGQEGTNYENGVNRQQELGGGEGHTIPLPFEAEAIYAVEGGGHGLLLQRAETTEDVMAWTTGGIQFLASPTAAPTAAAGSGAKEVSSGNQGDHEDNNIYNNMKAEDDQFVLKAPPRPVRLRDSLGGNSFASSLNVSTTAASTTTHGGGMGGGVGASPVIPSLFSLSHPSEDILPVSTFVDRDWQSSIASDVFEKVVFVGQAKWVPDETSGVPFLDRKEETQSICVTYHTQLKSHSIWEIKRSPAPPPPAPLWQISGNWRAKDGWDSHLGALQQGLDDMDLAGSTSATGGNEYVSQYDAANRNQALADALGVARRTPRSNASDSPQKRSSTVGRGRNMAAARRSVGNSSINASILSPMSRPGSTRNDSTAQSVGDFESSHADQSVMTTMGPFTNLHPKITLTCIYRDSDSSPPADNVFFVSNSKGSGTLVLCLVGADPSEKPDNPPAIVGKEIRMFSFAFDGDTWPDQPGSGYDGLSAKFCVERVHSMPCIAAQPVRCSLIPKNYEPPRRNKPAHWQQNATDILLLHTSKNRVNDKASSARLSLYRNTNHIADCAILGDEASFELTNLRHAVGNAFDMTMEGGHKSLLQRSVRGCISLTLDSCFLGERVLQAVDAALVEKGLEDLALKIRADCIRLYQSSPRKIEIANGQGSDAVKDVILSIFHQELSLATNALNDTSSSKQGSSWEKLMLSRYHEHYQSGKEVFNGYQREPSIASERFSGSDLSFLNAIGSLSFERLRTLNSKVSSWIFDALHLLYEDFKLHTSNRDAGIRYVGTILSEICRLASAPPSAGKVPLLYLSHYARDRNEESTLLETKDINILAQRARGDNSGSTLSTVSTPPCILSWLEGIISGSGKPSFYSKVEKCHVNAACTRTRALLRVFRYANLAETCSPLVDEGQLGVDLMMVKELIEEGFEDQVSLSDELPVGISLPLIELLRRCRMGQTDVSPDADAAIWSLVGREDLFRNSQEPSTLRYLTQEHSANALGSSARPLSGKTDNDGVGRLEITSSMLFPDDNRVREVCRLLRTSRPIFLRVPRPIELSDHDYERKKQEKLLLLSRRTLALPVGRGMLTIGNLKPVPAEPLPLPELCLSGRIAPTNATLVLDTSECPTDLKVWPEFHNGVAAGLRLPLHEDADEVVSKINRTWIVYNRPTNHDSQAETSNPGQASESTSKALNHAHGGLLMALGMRGHLTALEMTDVFDYLTHGTVTTTVGVLLGMAANMRGSCDMSVSKMLCLHIPSLIPQHFSTIDVASTVQAAAVAGAGLLYESSCHRMMTEFLLNEIGKRPSSDGNVLDREAYTLACGISLGMVNLCQGANDNAGTGAGLADLRIEERLYRYVVGGVDDAELRRRREESDRLSLQSASGSGNNEKCSCVYEGDSINTDVTAPGATLALGLMYMKSCNQSIASAISLPDTHFLLEFVRPDFLLLRVVSRALILWDKVLPTKEWVQNQLPKSILSAYGEMMELADRIQRGESDAADHEMKDYDRQSVRLIYTHVVAGACFSLGLRFAGTGNRDAASVIFENVMELRELRDGTNPASTALRPPTPVLEMCLGCAAISLTMVLAGTGDLDAFRLLMILRWPCSEEISYGSHLAYGTAIGLLFLGGGTCTLGREPADIAALLMAFYPRFPSTTSDNQYHLQAMRNLYALAVKHREVKAVDVDTGKGVFVPIELHFENESLNPVPMTTPFLLLNDDSPLRELRVVSNRYYPLRISFAGGLDKKTFFVKRRSHFQDTGKPSSGAIFVGTDRVHGKDALEFMATSGEDPHVVAFAAHFCDVGASRSTRSVSAPFTLINFCRRTLHECLQHDTQEALPIYVALRNCIASVEAGRGSSVSFSWDLRLIRSYYQRTFMIQKAHTVDTPTDATQPLLSPEMVAYLIELMEQAFARCTFDRGTVSTFYGAPNRKDVDLKEGNDVEDMDLS